MGSTSRKLVVLCIISIVLFAAVLYFDKPITDWWVQRSTCTSEDFKIQTNAVSEDPTCVPVEAAQVETVLKGAAIVTGGLSLITVLALMVRTVVQFLKRKA